MAERELHHLPLHLRPSEFSKAVNNPGYEVTPLNMMRGFINDFGHHTEDVLLVEGELHGDRKPVSFLPLPLQIT